MNDTSSSYRTPQMPEPSNDNWQRQRERGSPILLRLTVGIARLAGRRLTRLLLFPIVLYFLCTGGEARAASADYLQRVLGRLPGWRDHARHLYSFAACTLDRVFLLGGKRHRIHIVRHRSPEVLRVEAGERGYLVIASHLGSFEALRAPVAHNPRKPIRILMDRQHNPHATHMLEALSPELAAQSIDSAQDGPQLILALREALESGAIVGVMGDRVREGERSVEVDFLSGRVRLPASPWILAGILKVPVMIGFGLYRGGARYDNHIELFSECIDLPRTHREAAVQEVAQRYAERLEHYARGAPYNWFNWYRFWSGP